MGDQVEITNDGFTEWYENQNQNNEDLADAALVMTGLLILQLGIYYSLANSAVKRRDALIDKQKAFTDKLQEYSHGQDWDMAVCKSEVLTDLELPSVDMCSLSVICRDEILNDGTATDNKSLDYISKACGEIPECWGTHDGNLYASKAASVAGGLVANAAKRGLEDFRQRKTDLVRAGQIGMKGVFNANSISTKYSQATQIHAGLADMFMQGFNSAGAALGVALGNVNTSSSSGTSNAFAVGGGAQTAGLQGGIGSGGGST